MTTETDSFDDNVEPSSSLFEQSNTGGVCSIYLGSELTNVEPETYTTAGEGNKKAQALSDPVYKDRPAVEKDYQLLIEENRRLREENARLSNQARKLLAVNAFREDVHNTPDVEVTAQRMARRLQKLFGCDLVCIFQYDHLGQTFRLQAAEGASAFLVPPSFFPDPGIPAIQHAIQFLEPAHGNQLRMEKAFSLHGQTFGSLLVAPIYQRKDLHGLILLADRAIEKFSASDYPVVESAAGLLQNVWQYVQKGDSLIEFVQALSSLAIVQETSSLLEAIASLARRTLNASYTLIAVQNQQEWIIRGAGQAPKLLASLKNGATSFLDEACQSPYTFRMRDLRDDPRSAQITLDSPNFCSLLASPIRINGACTGVLLAFGKVGEEHFTDNDVFLVELLVSQAAVNLASCHLHQEIRSSFKMTQLLYEMSRDIAQAEDLETAARSITRTAYRLLQAQCSGMILLSSDGRKMAEVHLPSDDDLVTHPYKLIQQAMDSRQMIYIAESDSYTKVAIPIQTMRRCYGALWLELLDDQEEARHPTEEIRILVNHAAVALERSILLEETRRQTGELNRTNKLLIQSYDQLLEALMLALDARDSETEGHSARVKKMAVALGHEMGLGKSELKALERGSLLHDIGKIGIRDAVLLKPGPLDPNEWKLMRLHPLIGTRIIQEIPALHDALPVVAFHQERWDGSGYPLHLVGKDTPLLARIFAVIDVFDALTSERPYRTKMTEEAAVEYLEQQAGATLDPEVVAIFAAMMRRK